MFRLTRVIVRLRSETLNVFNDYVYFGITKVLQCLPVINILSQSEGVMVMCQYRVIYT
jgi:hypothetical protein